MAAHLPVTQERSSLGVGAAVLCAALAGVLLALALLPHGGDSLPAAPAPPLIVPPKPAAPAPAAPVPAAAPAAPQPAPDGRASAGAYPRHSGR